MSIQHPAGDALPSVTITFVAIGFNEGKRLRACLESLAAAPLPGISREIIYVDGGSSDDSLAIARACQVDLVLGGEKRRRAAENRNLGARYARGHYIHFVDGDMVMEPDWPGVALAFMDLHPEVAVVSGRLLEANTSYLYQVVQLDWSAVEGPVETCGGGALFRRSAFEEAGGFPEDVAYGEEPYLCWRVRNHLQKQVYFLDRTMARHDLGFSGFADYWRQYARNGATYIEVAIRCAGSGTPLWTWQCVSNFTWGTALAVALGLLALFPLYGGAPVAVFATAVYLRKLLQTRRQGHPWPIAAGYAVHVYASKIPLAWGQLRWLGRQALTGGRIVEN